MIDLLSRGRASSGIPHRSLRAINLVLGGLMLALGFIGALLPIMPTTIFLILAAWFFGRSSPRLKNWLLEHPRFGSTLRAWRKEGAIPFRIKIIAVSGMLCGYVMFFASLMPAPRLAIPVGILILGCIAFILTRTEPCASAPSHKQSAGG
ncbi:YbaN family protein [Agrobacterium sp. OT33]|uniref:YbaN family protein n=1 Tax=Agrobacterium sp. OT33 TaxID=2815338 RepID=UPI001A8C9473|nr:YbaN family protein [Agrobacterium sp. OT33]MBO0128363.1 YbaN family protein [Agrobacterium sp. OT33]